MKKINRRSDCPLSVWLDIFGDKWTVLILRDMLFFNKKNYKDFIAAEEKISTNILADRLKMLQQEGIITRSTDPNNGLLVIYELTEKGKNLAPVFFSIAKWSESEVGNVYSFDDLEKMQ